MCRRLRQPQALAPSAGLFLLLLLLRARTLAGRLRRSRLPMVFAPLNSFAGRPIDQKCVSDGSAQLAISLVQLGPAPKDDGNTFLLARLVPAQSATLFQSGEPSWALSKHLGMLI